MVELLCKLSYDRHTSYRFRFDDDKSRETEGCHSFGILRKSVSLFTLGGQIISSCWVPILFYSMVMVCLNDREAAKGNFVRCLSFNHSRQSSSGSSSSIIINHRFPINDVVGCYCLCQCYNLLGTCAAVRLG